MDPSWVSYLSTSTDSRGKSPVEGYTWALGHLAGSLKNLITGSQPWGGRWKNRQKNHDAFGEGEKKFPKVQLEIFRFSEICLVFFLMEIFQRNVREFCFWCQEFKAKHVSGRDSKSAESWAGFMCQDIDAKWRSLAAIATLIRRTGQVNLDVGHIFAIPKAPDPSYGNTRPS